MAGRAWPAGADVLTGGILIPVEYVFRKPTGSPADRGAAPPRYRLEEGPAGMIIERDVPVPVRSRGLHAEPDRHRRARAPDQPAARL
jgi:hypothetical protein